MKFLRIIAFILILSQAAAIVSSADNSYNWYFKKNGNNTPTFPENADFVYAHKGYYIDKKAAENKRKAEDTISRHR